MLNPTPRGTTEEYSLEPSFSFYQVEGISLAEIHSSLREQGPKDERGRPRFAYTDWTIEWNWGTTPAKSVVLDSLRVQCSVNIKLPKLAVTSNTPLSVLRLWNDFVERTRAHEMQHVEHVVRGAARIRERLKVAEARRGKLSPKQANAIVSRVIEEIREFDRTYDRRTNHGYTEGTWELSKHVEEPLGESEYTRSSYNVHATIKR
jgi:predicted secreted Zn-dependent protease